MSLQRLQSFDIREKDEEELVQKVINQKLLANPPVRDVYTADVPDIRTPEEEAEWQAKLDARRAETTPALAQLPGTEPEVVQEESGEVETEELVEEDKTVLQPVAKKGRSKKAK